MTVVQTVRLIKQLRQCEHTTDNKGNTIILTDYATSPFCLFHYIVMSRDDYANNRSFILTHEQEHIRLKHCIDLVLLQVATIMQWFNPFVWLIGKNLKAIHEFEVDEAVLNKGINATQYQKFLVIKAVGNRLQPFANNLNNESLKRRIIMMNQKKSNRLMMLKTLFIIPVATLAISVFASNTNVSTMAKATTLTATTLSTIDMQTQQPDTKVYKNVEVKPQFKGGESAMMEFIAKNVKYPQAAIDATLQGKTIVGFVVRKDGTISDVHIKKSSGHAVLDKEAMRVVKTMPAWKPGKQKGKLVNVKCNVPINFRIQ